MEARRKATGREEGREGVSKQREGGREAERDRGREQEKKEREGRRGSPLWKVIRIL